MKKILIVMAIFILTGTAFAKLNPEEKIMLNINGDYGYTLSGIESKGIVADSYYGKTFGIGFKAGYGLFTNGVVYGGLELQQRELVVKLNDDIDFWKEHYTQKYLDIPIAYRVLFGPMYADFGGYYSIRIGNMKWKGTGDYTANGTVEKKYTKNDYGLLLGLGGIIPVGENSGIDIGLKTKLGLSDVIDAPDFKVSCSSMILTLGYITIL